MPKLNKITSNDRRWKAWVEQKTLRTTAYQLVLRNKRWPFSQGPRTRKTFIGQEYYTPSSQFQQPDIPISLSIEPGIPRFTPSGVEVNIDYHYNYMSMPSRTEKSITKIKF